MALTVYRIVLGFVTRGTQVRFTLREEFFFFFLEALDVPFSSPAVRFGRNDLHFGL